MGVLGWGHGRVSFRSTGSKAILFPQMNLIGPVSYTNPGVAINNSPTLYGKGEYYKFKDPLEQKS